MIHRIESNFNFDGISDILLSVSQQQIKHHYVWDDSIGGFFPIDSVIRLKNKNLFWYYANPQLVDSNFPDNTKVADFNGDGKSDLLKIEDNSIQVYEMTTQGQFNNIFSTTKESLDEIMYFGDFNGDGKTDILAPIANDSSNWIMYISTGNAFRKELYTNFYLYKPINQGSPRKNRNTQRTYATPDLNKDGKSDFLIFESQVWFRDGVLDWNNPDSSYGFNYLRNEGVDPSGRPIFANVYHIDPKELNWDGEDINYSMYGEHYIPLFGNFRITQLNTDFAIIHKTKLITWDLGNKINKISKIKTITQGGIKTEAGYASLTSAGNIYKANDTASLLYPYVNIIENINYDIVSKLIQGDRKQDFRYKDMVGHLHGKGMLGFRQSARSTFYAGGLESTKVWSGSAMNLVDEVLPAKEWSIKTTSEDAVFPADISQYNSELLSFKGYEYKIEKRLNGNIVTSYSEADKPKIVTAVNPHITTSKDFQKDIKTVHIVLSYDDLYLPTKSTTDINEGFATTTTEVAYNAPITAGANYSIGKPLWKTETVQVYGDIKNGKEEYEYNGSLLVKKKTYNRDNTQYIEESYGYDGFGNIIQKTVRNPYNNDQVQAATIKSQYDDKGRFVIKKTDHLDLTTLFTYNNWGQILTQTDPLNNKLTNSYDAWGKLLTSNTNLSGTTTFTYEKLTNGDAKVTEYSPDDDQKVTYVNILGQSYKSSVKGFAQGAYISSEIKYDVLGRKIKESEPYFEGSAATKWNITAYDEYSRPIKFTSFTGKTVETTYQGRAVKTIETNNNNRSKTQVFDVTGKLYSVTDLGGTITYKYNAAGENTEAKYGTNTVKTGYDYWGRKNFFYDPANSVDENHAYRYEYNGYGQLIHAISPKGHKYYQYNTWGQQFRQTEVANDNTSTNKNIIFQYDIKGRLIKKTGTNKGEYYDSHINYDAHGRVVSSVESSNGKSYYRKNIKYDDKGRIVSYEKGLSSSGNITKATVENIYSVWNGELYQVKDQTSDRILWELTETNDKEQVLKAKLGGTDIENTYDGNSFLYSQVLQEIC